MTHAHTVTVETILSRYTRDSFAFTRMVSQRLGAVVTVIGLPRNWRPASVTIAAAALGLVTSAMVVLLGGGPVAAVVAVVGWQAAYALDCADGQLARASGRTSEAGAALDLSGDWLSRLGVMAALLVAVERGFDVPAAWVAVLATGLLSSLYHEALNRTGAVEDLARSRLRGVLGLARDPGVILLVFGVGIGLPPAWTLATVAYGAVLGGLQFLVRLVRVASRARRV